MSETETPKIEWPAACKFCGAGHGQRGNSLRWDWIEFSCGSEFGTEDGGAPDWDQDDKCRIAELEAQIAALTQRLEHLEKFKAYTHQRLDELGAPESVPESPHTAAGCRVGGRFDWVAEQVEQTERANREWEELDDAWSRQCNAFAERATAAESELKRLRASIANLPAAGDERWDAYRFKWLASKEVHVSDDRKGYRYMFGWKAGDAIDVIRRLVDDRLSTPQQEAGDEPGK